MNTQNNEIGALVEAVHKAYEPRLESLQPDGLLEHDEARVLLVPDGMKVESIKRYIDECRTAPERKRGTARLQDLDSFVAHVNRHSDDGSVLFADSSPLGPTIHAIYDYHMPKDGAARFGEHTAVCSFPLSSEWVAWLSRNEKSFDQASFAALLEERIVDILDPVNASENTKAVCKLLNCEIASPSALMALSRGLTVRVGQRVANHTNLASGEGKIIFETSHTDENAKPLNVPGMFLIGVPVFRNGARYQISARLHYRVNGGSLVWSFSLYRHDNAFDHAFDEACTKARNETKLPLFIGAP